MPDHPDFATDISDLHDLVIRHHEQLLVVAHSVELNRQALITITKRLILIEKNWE